VSASLSGRIGEFLLPQVISLLEVVQSNGRLEISGPEGRGEIAFRRGSIVDARLGSWRGELAACLMLSWSNGEFVFRPESGELPGELQRGNQSLCLEAMRLLDESRNPDIAVRPLGDPRAPDPDPDAERVLMAVRQGARSLGHISQACGLPPLAAYYHVEKLEKSGSLQRVAVSSPLTRSDRGEAQPVRVLVVDDSEFMRRTLTRLFESDASIEVVAAASGGAQALELLPSLRPDVISLDLHMPEMDGITTLKRIMLTHPTPTVIVTAASPDALDLTFDSILRFGAIDFITKPSQARGDIGEQGRYIQRRLRGAARVNLRGVRLFQPQLHPVVRRAVVGKAEGLVLAAGGTGGSLSLLQMLASLSADLPFAILGMLPFPDDFLRAFVSYMNRYSAFHVRLAEEGSVLASGVCYLASWARSLRIVREGQEARLALAPGRVGGDSDLLLYDATQAFGARAVGLLLSGEAREWTAGLSAVRAAGGITMAQLPETCVDPEGPAAALRQGTVDRVAVLNHLSQDLSHFFIGRLSPSGSTAAGPEGADAWPSDDA
jgi:two-component system, chemotaxis family, protein-glutamate methylesterase/glutaminase